MKAQYSIWVKKLAIPPLISDVSDDDLVEMMKQLKNSENIIQPMPLPICHTPFDVFKPNRGIKHTWLENQ